MAIYTSKKSNRKHIQALLTYARDLRNMSRQNYDWSAYDRQFRMDLHITLCSWSLVRHDLHLMFWNPQSSSQNSFPATRFPSTLPQTNTLTTPDGFILKKGHCIKFHSRGKRCEKGSACTFSYKCNKCSSFHPIYETCSIYRHRFLYRPQTNQPLNTHHKTTYTERKHYSKDSRNWFHCEIAYPGQCWCIEWLFVSLWCRCQVLSRGWFYSWFWSGWRFCGLWHKTAEFSVS